MDLSAHTALLGGSFNPLHVGHLRIAQEVVELCNPSQLFFVPTAHPPHKSSSHLLPYAIREEMLQCSLAGHERMKISGIELEHPGLSYTVDTLQAFHAQGTTRLLFIMGLDDLPFLPTWKDWRKITTLADIVLLPRSFRTDDVMSLVTPLWKDALVVEKSVEGKMHISLGEEGNLWYIPQPVFEVSSSLIRSRWLEGRSIQYFVPQPVETFLKENSDMVRSIWSTSDR